MHRTRLWVAATFVMLFGLVAAACGVNGDEGDAAEPAPDDGTHAAEPDDGDLPRIGLALSAPRNDEGWSQAHYEGLLAAEEQFDIQTSIVENANLLAGADVPLQALRDMATDNDMVIGAGADFADAGPIVASEFPDTVFMIVNGEPSDDPNLAIFGIREGVPAYIAGVVAAQMTQTGRAGFVGGDEIPPLYASEIGFEAGFRDGGGETDPASIIVGDFLDVEGSYSATQSMIADGADMFYGYLDRGMVGVVEAIQDEGIDGAAFGIIFLKCDLGPEIVAGGSIVSLQDLVVTMIDMYLNDEVPTEPQFFGVEDPDIQRFELCPNLADEELQQLIDETVEGINDGSIQLPDGV